MKVRWTLLAVGLGLAAVPAQGHHGVASLGVAGLEGPGAPIETSNSATLPQAKFLAYMKLDYAKFDTFTPERDDEGDYNAFWMYGLGFGATSYFSGYLFVPFSAKVVEDNSFNTAGFADIALMGVLGMKWDRGVRLVPKNESLDEMEDLHFAFYGGLTLPTGEEDIENSDGEIDPGMSLGFGTPSYTAGLNATRMLTSRTTLCLDLSQILFTENEYADGSKTRFGGETRLNLALNERILTRGESGIRLDANMEANYLGLGRDEANGVGEDATGGKMLYALPGFRLFVNSASVGIGVKVPIWTDLNESDDQQGAEGKESYRLVLTFSSML